MGISNLMFSQIDYSKSTWIIKGNATSLLDILTFPAVELSIEKSISSRVSMSAEAGYQIYDFRHTDTSFLDPNGFKVNFEVRYYFSGFSDYGLSNRSTKVYSGLRPFYRQNEYNANIPFRQNLNSGDWHDDDFGVKKRSYGLYCVLGMQKSITDKLLFDFHTGLGIINRSVKNTELQYNKDSGHILGGSDLIQFFERLNLNESSGIWASFVFGIRIGFKL